MSPKATMYRVLVLSTYLMSAACGSNDAAYDASEGELTVRNSTIDASFGSNGRLSTRAPVTVAPDGTLANAYFDAGELVIEQRDAQGRAVNTFGSGGAVRERVESFGRNQSIASTQLGTFEGRVCHVVPAKNGTIAVTGYVTERRMHEGQTIPLYSSFTFLASRDGKKTSWAAQSFSYFGWQNKRPICLPPQAAPGGSLEVRSSVESNGYGFRAIVPMDASLAPADLTRASHATFGRLPTDQTVLLSGSTLVRLSTSNGRIYGSVDRGAGPESWSVPFGALLRIDSMAGGNDGILRLLVSGDARGPRIEWRRADGTEARPATALSAILPADHAALSLAVDDAGRTWLMTSAYRSAASQIVKQGVLRLTAQGTVDTTFGVATLEPSSAQELVVRPQTQGQACLVGGVQGGQYVYVRLR